MGLRRRSIPSGTVLHRIDGVPAENWRWDGFEVPRHRFDPASGRFRTRYAATSIHGAARERYTATGRYIPADHRDHSLVTLTTSRAVRVLDLRTEANLDALQIDDRINSSHEAEVWGACQRLVDRLRGWWDDLDGVAYRARTTPSTSVNIAIFSTNAFETVSRPLHTCAAELDGLIVHHRFTVGFDH